MTPERYNRMLSVIKNRQTNLTVVMENVNDPHNISAVMRTCDAVGIQDLYILNTKIAKHDYFGVKSSSSAAKWLTVHQFTNVADCFEALRKNYNKIFTTHLSSDAVSLYELDFTDSVALVFGNEHDGVSEETIAMSDGNFIIPQLGFIQSLNISVACAVSIYEAHRQKMAAGHYLEQSMTKERQDALLRDWGVED
jgi:tRNA (guanosine-2'-O-)-methyltransferase